MDLNKDLNQLDKLTDEQLKELAKSLEALKEDFKYHKADYYFPDHGRLSRDKYPVQMDLMRATITHKICALIGGNGSGKTLWNSYVANLHATGKYTKWWEGERFYHPVNMMLASINGEQLRDGIQKILFGGIGDEDIGSGIIAREDILDDSNQLQKWTKPQIAGCIALAKIRWHDSNGKFGGWSTVVFKVYEQGWAAFQGSTYDYAGLDEEPEDPKIMAEIYRSLRPKDGGEMGSLLATFTPTHGFTDVFLSFVPNGVVPETGTHPDNPIKYTAMLSWKLDSDENAPHLTEQYKKAMVAEWGITDPNNLEARMTGMAAMGSGRVYPIFEIVESFPIPNDWKRCFGMDPGARNFACVWGAKDPNTGVTYIYDEYKTKEHRVAIVHCEAIRSRGKWIRGGIDPHEAVKPRDTGESVQAYYNSNGVDCVSAGGDPDALRMKIRAKFESGSYKIMSTCQNLINEARVFRFDGKRPDRIARNQDDHLCDAMMYMESVIEYVGKSESEHKEEAFQERNRGRTQIDEEGPISDATGY